MTATTIQTIRQARAILSDSAKWTQGAIARDDAGAEVEWDNTSAASYCLLGAVRYAAGHLYGQRGYTAYAEAVDTLAEWLDGYEDGIYGAEVGDWAREIVGLWNDALDGHAWLLQGLDSVIEDIEAVESDRLAGEAGARAAADTIARAEAKNEG